jgi:hypothetical protein
VTGGSSKKSRCDERRGDWAEMRERRGNGQQAKERVYVANEGETGAGPQNNSNNNNRCEVQSNQWVVKGWMGKR